MLDYIVNGTKNIFRKRLRSILTILGISIGVLSVVIISTIGEVGKREINSEIDSIGMSGLTVRTIGNVDTLYTKQLEAIKSINEVSEALPLMLEYTQASMRGQKTDCAAWGVDNGAQDVVSMTLLHGRYINQSDIAAVKNVCIVDESYAEKLYKRTNVVGKAVKIMLNGKMEDFEVVGVVKTGGSIMQDLIGSYIPCFVYIPFTTLKSYTGKGNFDQIAVKLKSDADAATATKEIKTALSSTITNSGNVRVENMVAQRAQLDMILEVITFILSLIAGISLVVSGLSIMTVMLVSVNERTKEIGIKKSIGASKGKIMAEFLSESFIISLFGSLAGIVIGVLISAVSCMLVGVTLRLNVEMIIISGAFAVFVGVLFGVYPAFQAAKLRPVDALRSEL